MELLSIEINDFPQNCKNAQTKYQTYTSYIMEAQPDKINCIVLKKSHIKKIKTVGSTQQRPRVM